MASDPSPTNAVEWSVTDLAGALKRTLEDAFGYVRLRGEISGYRGPHSSGHVYFNLKDQNACIDAVMWKTSYARLRVKPQDGLEVVATGRITTFPGKSKYQIVVDRLEPAGVGALMALLEERRRKLTAAGLFESARKRELPFLPRVIGVVTSPTGAVIRDILHRLADRFPRAVLVWPVRVQGETSADEVAAGIRGFNALSPDGAIARPDVIIVARGGGSLEDLWSFNEEIVVRAAAESEIPIVAAIGHETDTTLIDHAADRRAPTPTGAAEMVVPVRVELLASVNDLARRHGEATLRGLERRRSDLGSLMRAMPASEAFFAARRQRLDLASAKLKPALARNARDHEIGLNRASAALSRHSPAMRLATGRARLDQLGHRLLAARGSFLRAEAVRIGQRRDLVRRAGERLAPSLRGQLERKLARLGASIQLLDSLSYKSVLARGFALVRDADGRPVRSVADASPGRALAIEFADGQAKAVVENPRPAVRRGAAVLGGQGSLFEP